VAGWLAGRATGEEIVFRFPLTTSRSTQTRALLSTTAFAGMHAVRGRRAVTVQLLNGAAWGRCAAANGSVFWPVLAHTVYNAAIVLRGKPTVRQGRWAARAAAEIREDRT
jgi:membrane protease YdiL (CAAX protease family)